MMFLSMAKRVASSTAVFLKKGNLNKIRVAQIIHQRHIFEPDMTTDWAVY